MKHLTPDELIDAVEGTLEPDARRHLESCELCQREVAALTAAMTSAAEADVPEPSPLFWQHFSNRVREAIDAEPERAAGWRVWLSGGWRWSALVPIGALAVLVVALVLSMPRGGINPEPLANDSGNEVLTADDNWVLVADLVGDIDWDTAHAAGLTVEPGAVDRAVLQLSADEQAELARLLQAELMRAKS